ncbi:MAG TPA: GNAT family N-acetyltransferase [Dehalococcoidia bacterium]|nr:GNAT family N-acetyltransferase [Dehalococcoidia bacterium]
MTTEFRPITLEELDEFKRVAGNALVQSPDTFIGMRPEFTLCAFEDGKLSTTFAAWPFTMRFNGTAMPVGAVTTIGTFPVYRRRGYLRKITSLYFQQLHEEGERPIAILYASHAEIYQRYGYAVVSTQGSYNITPDYLRFVFPNNATGAFKEIGDDDFPLLVNLYRQFREERTGFLHRGREMWNAGVLAAPPAGGFLQRVVYEEAGEPLGYAVYTAQPGTARLPGNTISIRDITYLKPSVYRAIWDFFAKMDIVENIAWERVPADDPLPHLLLEPRMLHANYKDGILGRIVDVERTMTGRCYDETSVLTFEVIDDFCPWNQGTWKLETSPEGSSIMRTDETPQLVMPVSTLALLVFGQVNASEAARMARLDVNKQEALPVWDKTMRTRYRPACSDSF